MIIMLTSSLGPWPVYSAESNSRALPHEFKASIMHHLQKRQIQKQCTSFDLLTFSWQSSSVTSTSLKTPSILFLMKRCGYISLLVSSDFGRSKAGENRWITYESRPTLLTTANSVEIPVINCKANGFCCGQKTQSKFRLYSEYFSGILTGATESPARSVFHISVHSRQSNFDKKASVTHMIHT